MDIEFGRIILDIVIVGGVLLGLSMILSVVRKEIDKNKKGD